MDPEDPFRDSASEGALPRGPLRVEVSKVASSSSEEGGGSAIGDSATRNLEGKGHSLTCKWHNATRPEALASTRPRCTLNSPAVMSAWGPYPHHAASSLVEQPQKQKALANSRRVQQKRAIRISVADWRRNFEDHWHASVKRYYQVTRTSRGTAPAICRAGIAARESRPRRRPLGREREPESNLNLASS